MGDDNDHDDDGWMDFSPIGSSILNKSGVIVEDRMNVSYIWIKMIMITFAADSNGASNAV